MSARFTYMLILKATGRRKTFKSAERVGDFLGVSVAIVNNLFNDNYSPTRPCYVFSDLTNEYEFIKRPIGIVGLADEHSLRTWSVETGRAIRHKSWEHLRLYFRLSYLQLEEVRCNRSHPIATHNFILIDDEKPEDFLIYQHPTIGEYRQFKTMVELDSYLVNMCVAA